MIFPASPPLLLNGNELWSAEDGRWMQYALHLAKQAAAQEEVPVGAVVVRAGQVLGEGWNCPITHCDPTAHAEIVALRTAASQCQNYRLCDTTLYVTLEPCLMCIGAITHARVQRVVYGAPDARIGAVKALAPLALSLNHHVEYIGGVLAVESGNLLRQFFLKKRNPL